MRYTRLAMAAAVSGLLVAGGAATAHAADVAPTPLTQADKAEATQVATSGKAMSLARRAAELQAGAKGTTNQGFGAATKKNTPDLSGAPADVVDGTTTQVNILSPEFVARGRGPVGKLGYVANTVKVGDQVVTIWSARNKDGDWTPINAAAGDLEAQYGRRAAGGQVLHEPQINAWYAVKGGRVLPLNSEAQAAVGQGVSLSEYRTLVAGKYADKMPGSAYDRQGMAGGFGEPAAAQVAPAAASAPTQTESGSSAGLIAGVGALGAAGLGSAAMARRRRSEA